MRYRVLESWSSRCLHQAIAVSEGTRRFWMVRTGIAEDRIVTIHNGVDPDRIRRENGRHDARRRLGIPDDGRVILGGVGRLDVAKGFTHLIDAMAILQQECPNAVLVIAGSGPLEESLAAQVASLGLQNSITFLGYCQDVALVYDALDVFVLSSICDAMPFALLEAMSHELPAVGTTVGGVPEVIVSGETGFLAEPRDGDALARAILPLLGSEGLRDRLGAAGRERVIRHFGEAEMVRKTVDVYRDLLNAGSH
jgi:glycosyltransferase involved in cell wall biosynthesis